MFELAVATGGVLAPFGFAVSFISELFSIFGFGGEDKFYNQLVERNRQRDLAVATELSKSGNLIKYYDDIQERPLSDGNTYTNSNIVRSALARPEMRQLLLSLNPDGVKQLLEKRPEAMKYYTLDANIACQHLTPEEQKIAFDLRIRAFNWDLPGDRAMAISQALSYPMRTFMPRELQKDALQIAQQRAKSELIAVCNKINLADFPGLDQASIDKINIELNKIGWKYIATSGKTQRGYLGNAYINESQKTIILESRCA